MKRPKLHHRTPTLLQPSTQDRTKEPLSEHIIPIQKEIIRTMLADGKIEQVVAMGTGAIHPLIELLKDSNVIIKDKATESLVKFGSSAVPALIEALKDRESAVTWKAIFVLGEIGDPRAIPVLVQSLYDERISVREIAADSFYKFGPVVVSTLIKLSKSEDPRLQIWATRAFGWIKDANFINELENGLKDENRKVEENVTESLYRIGSPSLRALIKSLLDPEVGVRERATRVIKRIAENTPSKFGREVASLINGELGDALLATDKKTVEVFLDLEDLMHLCGGLLDGA